jgi:hypothetical protein
MAAGTNTEAGTDTEAGTNTKAGTNTVLDTKMTENKKEDTYMGRRRKPKNFDS